MNAFMTLQDALDTRAAGPQDLVFINGDAGESRLPYARLRARALAVLHHLQQAGAEPGSELVLLTDRNEQFVDVFWACMYGRIAAVPIAPGNADEHRLKLLRVLARLERPVLATERKTFDRVAAFAKNAGEDAVLARLGRHIVFLDEITDTSKAGTLHRAHPDDIALVQFSSGSTSEPKGVVLTNRNLLTNIDAIVAGIDATAADRSLSWMPLTHDMGLIGFHLTPIVAGVPHALMPTALFVRRPRLWIAKASQHRSTVLCSPNFGYRHYLNALEPGAAAAADLTRVRVVFNGAEPISADLCREFLAALAPAGLGPDVMFPVYGLAEASLAVTFPPPGRALATVTLDRRALGPEQVARAIHSGARDAVSFVKLGTAVRGCELRVAAENGARLPDGTVGRLLIRGDNVTSGYYRDPATTNAVRTGDGWLDTGDLGAMIDGELVVTGRVKEILFVAGQNHYPQDIEKVIETHAGVEPGRAAAAGTRPANAATDDVLVFVAAKGALRDFVPLARTIRRVVNEKMGLVIAAVIPVTRLPKTTSGKIRRFALARDYEDGAFADALREIAAIEAAAQAASVGADGNAVEHFLLEVCRSLLPEKTIGLDDNIFEMGTSSLTLAQIYERVDAAYPGQLEVTDFFEYPTVRAMAGFLARQASGTA